MDVPKIFGRYQPLQVLGAGSGSRVMLVKDLLDGEIRALKVLLDEAGTEGFFREFELLASIRHPQVVRVFDFGQDASGLRYFTMEYLRGRPLAGAVSDALAVDRIQRIAVQLLSALAAIHTRGILHADLKPQNIFLLEDAEEGDQIKLLDFGLAGLRKDKDPGKRRGTLPYMAPEWFVHEQADYRSDLYSAGVVLYELLTGQPPFQDRRGFDLIKAKVNDPAPPVESLREDCPVPLARLVNALLERDPALRPQTAAEALKMLEDSPAAGSTAAALMSGMPLVGRERLMASARATLETVITTSAGHMLLFSADGGNGKTRILHELKSLMQREGRKLLEARGGDVQGEPPLRQLLISPARLEAEANKPLLQRYQSVVQHLFDDQESRGIQVLPPAEALGFLDGLASFLLELAARHAMVILFDDLHRADPMTQDMFVHLGLRLAEAPLLVCATVDPAWIESREDYQELTERPDVEVVKLEPLQLDDLQMLLKETFGAMPGQERLAAQLVEATGGNLAMVSEALESLVASGALFTERGRWYVSEEAATELLSSSAGMDQAAALFKRRIDPLNALDRELLDAAAVLGSELDEGALRGLAGGGAWIKDALGRLIQWGLLEAEPAREGHLRFQQPRLQAYLMAQMPVEKRRALHRRAAEFVLASLGASVSAPERLEDEPLDELARHFLAAGDLEAGRLFGQHAAARAEQRQAFRHALERYQQLLQLARSHNLPPPPDIREKIADLQQPLGRTDDALQGYQALLDEDPRWESSWLPAPLDQLPARARLFFKIGSVKTTQGNYPEALEAFLKAMELVPSDDLLARLRLLSEQCNVEKLKGDLAAAEQTALSGLALAGSHPSPRLIAPLMRLHIELAHIAGHRGRLTDAEHYISSGLDRALDLPDILQAQESREVHRYTAGLYFTSGIILRNKGEYTEAIQAILKALGHAETLRDLNLMAKCYNNIGVIYFHMGDWGEAIDYWERFKDIAERARAKAELANACNNLGSLYKDTGQLEKAGATFEQGLKLARRLNFRVLLPMLLGNLGEVRARQGNYDEARRFYEQAVQLARELQASSDLAENLRRMAELSLDEGRLTRVRKEVHEALEITRQTEARLEEANLMALQAAEAAERGLTDRALAVFRQAEEVLKHLKADFERARLKYRQGLAFNKLGFPSEAETALRFAEETFRRLGATWELRRTQEALKKLGGEGGGSGLAFKKLQLLLDVTRTLGSELELEPLLARILDKAIELTHTERGFVILLDDRGNPTFHSTRQMAREEVEGGQTAQISSTVIQRVVSSGTSLAVTNVDQEFDLRAQASIVALGLRSIMCAPLKRGDKVMGVIYVDSNKITEGFYQADVSLLEALADAAAISLENAQLVASLRRKTDLMSILAHEFRSPITASITFTHQMLREGDRLNADQKENLEAILEQSYRLSRMINNILELAKMEANKVEWWMEELTIDQVLTTSARGLAPIAKEKHVQVVVKPAQHRATVYGNPDRLIQVCTNLLGNALKFTPERGRVEISTDIIEIPRPMRTKMSPKVPAGETWVTRTLGAGKRLSETSFLAVRFADTGPGIPLEDLERIFGKFAQTGDHKARSEGTGLGLTIAREIVTQHGGRMWAENAPTGGAMFVFCLPLVVPA